jgi:hypothetical protein
MIAEGLFSRRLEIRSVDIVGAAALRQGRPSFTATRKGRIVAVVTLASAASSAPTAENPEASRMSTEPL